MGLQGLGPESVPGGQGKHRASGGVRGGCRRGSCSPGRGSAWRPATDWRLLGWGVWDVTDLLLFLFFFCLLPSWALLSHHPLPPCPAPAPAPASVFVVSAGGSALPPQCLQRRAQPPGPPRLPSTGPSSVPPWGWLGAGWEQSQARVWGFRDGGALGAGVHLGGRCLAVSACLLSVGVRVLGGSAVPTPQQCLAG